MIEDAVMQTLADGITTPDLGGEARSAEMTDAIIQRMNVKGNGWGGLGR